MDFSFVYQNTYHSNYSRYIFKDTIFIRNVATPSDNSEQNN